MVKVINFSHRFTDPQRAQIQNLVGEEIAEILIDFHIDFAHDLSAQIVEYVNAIPLPPEELKAGGYLIRIPAFAEACAALLAELHGRSGHFPSIVLFRREGTTFEAYSVSNLQHIRDTARARRFQ